MTGGARMTLANKLMNKAEVALGRTRLVSRPLVVDVVLTKACNFACTFCKDYETVGAQRISLQSFEKMASQLMPTASQLSICSGGEPYLHTGLEEILRIARKYNPKLYIWVLSNGSIIREKRMRGILEEGLITEHGFSVDGATAPTVEAIRLNGKFDEIVANIKTVVRLRRALAVKAPAITVRYALMRSNVEELPRAIEMWAEIGVERLDVGYLSLANDMDPNLSLFYNQDLLQKCLDEARKTAERFSHLKVSLPEHIADQQKYLKEPKPCRSPWEFVMVDTNGQILPCYRAFEALRLPSLYEGAQFDEIWNSRDYQLLRATVNNDARPKHYPYCNVCEFRHGWSEERVHLGDHTWTDTLGEKWVAPEVDHKRPLKGTAAKM